MKILSVEIYSQQEKVVRCEQCLDSSVLADVVVPVGMYQQARLANGSSRRHPCNLGHSLRVPGLPKRIMPLLARHRARGVGVYPNRKVVLMVIGSRAALDGGQQFGAGIDVLLV